MASRESTELRALRIFHEVARAITSAIELDAILRKILEQMAHYFQPESWSLLMLDEAKHQWYYALAAGLYRDAQQSHRAFGFLRPAGQRHVGKARIAGDIFHHDRPSAAQRHASRAFFLRHADAGQFLF